LFDYEKEIFDALQQTKYVWIKKATGLGITGFMLRYISWLCLRDDKLKGSRVCIVTGPRIELAITLINRLRSLFSDIKFQDKETVCELNAIRIEAFLSHNLDSMRGLDRVSLILLDEGDFFPIGQQQEARVISERYIAKSDPYIIWLARRIDQKAYSKR
jgi:late competence protein required for DNA uptake (superfamily II DNA/RNA helicase)